jgi:hypothetical protein
MKQFRAPLLSIVFILNFSLFIHPVQLFGGLNYSDATRGASGNYQAVVSSPAEIHTLDTFAWAVTLQPGIVTLDAIQQTQSTKRADFTSFSPFMPDDNRPTGALRGTVFDEATLEPLAGVNVLLEGTVLGAATDLDGRFDIPRVPVGVYNVRVQYIGFETRTLTDVVVSSSRATNLDVRLAEMVIQGSEVTITAGFFQRQRETPVSRVGFNPEEIRRSPGSGQELSRILAALPGVASGGDINQDLMVRGGSPNENAFYIDNILMPGVAHFSLPGGSSNGPIGIVNTDLIADAQFSAGGFQASFGNYLSSVTEITYREGNRNGLQGDALFSMAGLGFNAEGGFSQRRGSFLVSARRSYLDLIASALNTGGAPRYSDVQAKLVYDPNQRNRLTGLLIWGKSRFDTSIDEAIEQGLTNAFSTGNVQVTAGINHRYIWKSSGFTQTSVSYSNKVDDILGTRISNGSTTERFDIVNDFFFFRSVSRYAVSTNLNLEFGGDARYEWHQYDYFIESYRDRLGNFRPEVNQDITIEGLLAGVYAMGSYRVQPRWTLTGGFRADYTQYNGNIDIAPRISSNVAVTERLDFSLAYGIYYQPNTRYLMSRDRDTRKLENMRAMHYVAGLGYQLTEDTRLAFEVYLKEYDQIPRHRQGAGEVFVPEYMPDNFLGTHGVLASDGRARAYGVDLLLQKKLAQNLYGMVSISAFRSKYEAFDGTWYNRNYDNRLLLNVIGGYRPNERHEFSARWSFQGGGPWTPFDQSASIATGNGIFDMTRFNAERLPDYHTLYLRADRRVFFQRSSMVTFVELWNTYGRRNLAGYYWSSTRQETVGVRQFGFLPVGGVKFEF